MSAGCRDVLHCKTKWHFDIRVREHLNLDADKPTAVADHIRKCTGCQSGNLKQNFEIVRKCNSDYDSQIQEALLIQKLKPKLNKQLFENGASYKLLILVFT